MTENNHDNVLLRSVPLNPTGNLSLSQPDDLLQLAAQSFANQVSASSMNVSPDLISCSGLTSISDGDGMIMDWSQGV